ncbi:hypothetical protein CERZMDRAFT_86597 [Cercospora zeae-maydis SCOH1-5]|uniref:Uncharacterized protein n=1 Tax=Cercospora zeae-maydis SCOH1-5 TaxID=717836 RepID=A0A6A6F991_9PEZI|nr:hypothetical protein CERZMDRAFT_86597 [Cercospora zeae-maydis SCOH1-5]
MALTSFFKLSLYALSTFYLASATPIESELVVRAPDGRPKSHAIRDISKELRKAAEAEPGRAWKKPTAFAASCNDAPLLQLGASKTVMMNNKANASLETEFGIEITCRTCSLKGVVAGELSLSRDFNISQTVDEVKVEISESFDNFTMGVERYIDNFVDEIGDQITEANWDFDGFEFPTTDVTFDADITSIPDTNLRSTFDELELYMLIDSTLSLGSTYALLLYRSQGPRGLKITDDLELGLIFDVELILSAEVAGTIASGLHLKIDDGFAIDMVLFWRRPFTSHFTSFHQWDAESKSAFFANIAELTTNVTYALDDEKCALVVAQSHQFALGAAAGAAAGATAHIGTRSWGSIPNTTTAIYTIEVALACAKSGTPPSASVIDAIITSLPTATADFLDRRQNSAMVTLAHETTYTGVNCLSAGLINCPASLQNTSLSQQTFS